MEVYCVVLCCVVLYCVVLYCVVLCCIDNSNSLLYLLVALCGFRRADKTEQRSIPL